MGKNENKEAALTSGAFAMPPKPRKSLDSTRLQNSLRANIKPGRYIMYHSITVHIGKYILKCIHTLLKVKNSNSFNSSFIIAFITQPE